MSYFVQERARPVALSSYGEWDVAEKSSRRGRGQRKKARSAERMRNRVRKQSLARVFDPGIAVVVAEIHRS